jgi:polyketide synthase PksN
MLLASGWMGDRQLKVLCGGEALARDLADQLVRVAGEVWNLYGPTETTIWSSISKVDTGGRVTIGRPIANTRFYILDDQLRPVWPGLPGELYIAGDGVAQGYFNRPDLTGERFVPCPFDAPGSMMYRTGDVVRLLSDGTVDYLHRVDRQVKLYGHRIEPEEIEYGLRQHPSVQQAVVVVHEDVPGDQRLVAFLKLNRGSQPNAGELRRHLERTLPAYEIPSAYVALDHIPLTLNGKVDYQALPKPFTAGGALKPAVPANELELKVAAIWTAVLRHDRVSLDDTFFEVGGNSLLLMEVVKRLQQEWRRPLTSVEMFAHPTVRSMAAYLGGRRGLTIGRVPARRELLSERRRRRLDATRYE